MRRAIYFLFLIPFLFAWHRFETPHFVVYYFNENYREAAERVAFYLENHQSRIGRLTGNPRSKTMVVLQDMGELPNGFTDPIAPSVHVFTSIPYPHPEFGTMLSWWREVSVHEYTHACHLTSVRGPAWALRFFIGKAFLPNLFSPHFVQEGIPVLSESLSAPYEGRLNEGTFRAYFRALAEERAFPSLSFIMAEPAVYPYYSIRYIFGGEFFGFLADRYGLPSIADFIKTYSYSLSPYLGFEFSFSRAFRKPVGLLYKEFVRSWKPRRRKARVVFRAHSPLKWLTAGGGKLYMVISRPYYPLPYSFLLAHQLLELDPSSGRTRHLSWEVEFALPLKFRKGSLYYGRLSPVHNRTNRINLGYSYAVEIVELDLKTRRKRAIFKGFIKGYGILQDGRIIYSVQKGCCRGQIRIYDPETGRDALIMETDGVALDFAVKGKKIALILHRDAKGTDLYMLNLKKKKLELVEETPFVETSPVWNGEGKLLLAANMGGEWELYEVDPERKRWRKLTSESYATFPSPCGGKVYFIGLHSRGNYIGEAEMDGEEIEPERGHSPTPEKVPLSLSEQAQDLNLSIMMIPDLYGFYFQENELGEAYPYFFTTGHDGLEENYYFLQAGGKGFSEIAAEFMTFSLSPFVFDLGFASDAESKTLFLQASTPLFYSFSGGTTVSFLSLSYTKELQAGGRGALSASVDLSFSSPSERTHFFLAPEAVLEGSFTGSSVDRKALYLTAGFMQVLSPKAAFSQFFLAGYDPENPEPPEISILSSTTTYLSYKFLRSYSRLSFRIASIRKGLSNPAFFFDGLYLSLFGEYLKGDLMDRAATGAGALLSIEISTYHGLAKLYPQVGLSYRFDEGRTYFLIGVSGYLIPFKLFKKILPNPLRPSFGKHFFLPLLEKLMRKSPGIVRRH